MTVNNMVEVIRELHPKIGKTQVIFDLNRAQIEFCRESRVLTSKAILERSTDLVSEDTTKFTSRWRLPDSVFEVLLVDQVYSNDYYLTDNFMDIRWIDKRIQRMEVDYIRYPKAIALDGDQPEFSELFHDALVARVLERYFARDASNMPAMQFWSGTYNKRVLEAKRYSNTRAHRNENPSVGGVKTITTFKTGLSLIQGVNPIQMDKTFSTKDSYAIYLNGNSIQVDEYSSNPLIPHADRTTSKFYVFSADINPGTFDYIVTGT